jgi:hypothetical protein
MKKLIITLIAALIFATNTFAIDVQNDETDVITYFVMRDQTSGTVDTGVTIGNLEMYYIEDQASESADAFVGAHGADTDAHTDGECIHVGHGMYRVDWPDAAFDGGIGKRVQLILVDGDGGAFTEILEVQLSPPTDVITVLGTTPFDSANNPVLLTDGTGAGEISLTNGAIDNVVLVATTTTNTDAFDPSSTGVELLDSGGSAGTSASELVDDTWDEALIGGSPGQAKFIIPTILVDTIEIGTAGVGLTEAGGDGDQFTNIGTIATVTDVTNDVGITSGAVDDIWAKAMVDLVATPAFDDSVLEALNWMYLLSLQRMDTVNLTSSTAEIEVYNDNGDKISESDISDNGTTFTRGAFTDGDKWHLILKINDEQLWDRFGTLRCQERMVR